MMKRFIGERIICVLEDHEGGRSAQELCRKAGISDKTFITLRARHHKVFYFHRPNKFFRCQACWVTIRCLSLLDSLALQALFGLCKLKSKVPNTNNGRADNESQEAVNGIGKQNGSLCGF